jgi:integrase
VWVQHFADRPKLVLQWHDPETGKRKSQSAGTCNPLEAEKVRADLEYELNHGLHKRAASMSWERFRELFEEEYLPGVREDTRLVYRNVFRLFEEVCAPRSLRSITERTVSAFAAGLRKRPGRGNAMMAPLSVKVRLSFLRTALSWAAAQKLLPAVPEFPRVRVPKTRPRPVPPESFERLLAKAADQQTRTFLLCGWLGGLRRNEALALRWEESEEAPWLDLERDRIILPAGFVKAVEDQWVPLDPDLRAALEALPRHGPRVFRFVSRVTGEELTSSGVSLMITKLAKAAGVRLSMKALRKGFGCRYAGKVPAQVLQKLMRHASIRTTTDYYSNVDEAAEEAVLGARRNRTRNTGPQPAGEAAADANANL